MATSGNPQPDSLWLRPQHPRRLPQVALSREEIARAALALADAEGTDAVTMRRIAKELGCGTMSLYRHVRTKDEVFDLMVDTAIAREERPEAPSGDWRADLRELAVAKRAVLLRHPWLARLIAGRPVLGPGVLASTEFSLSVVAGLGLPMDEMVRIINTLNAFVNGFVQTEVEESAWRRPPAGRIPDPDPAHWHARVLPYLRHVMDSGEYPHFTRMVNEAESYPDRDADFAWQLARVLDGLSAVDPHRP
ncbi:TetR/AcrR family transcriptional regulator [Streptomyces uncialis]|uniref:TetR/AcrR family transcriptional regulator n=1 Tax=Streptomyces uncialis TaxID=1048205 RepID=UPI0036614B67